MQLRTTITTITLATLLCACVAARGDDATSEPLPAAGADVTLVSEAAAIAPGTPFTVALRVRHAPGYHTYWRNPGVIGLPTSIKWDLPDGFTASAIRWQAPELSKMAVYTVWGYESEALLLIDITPPKSLSPGERVTLKGTASWMACAKNCHPTSGPVSATLPVAGEPRLDAKWHTRFDAVRAGLPRDVPQWSARASRTAKGFTLTLTPRDPEAVNAAPSEVYFFCHDRAVSSNDPQVFRRVGDRYVLTLAAELNTPDEVTRLTGHVYCPTGWLRDGGPTAMSIDVPLDAGE
ncbi:MAG: hypothetical protein GC159_03120 [Phycisphaera sp.]|nr:hypothetical protein [Phycisphaera sp.]